MCPLSDFFVPTPPSPDTPTHFSPSASCVCPCVRVHAPLCNRSVTFRQPSGLIDEVPPHRVSMSVGRIVTQQWRLYILLWTIIRCMWYVYCWPSLVHIIRDVWDIWHILPPATLFTSYLNSTHVIQNGRVTLNIVLLYSIHSWLDVSYDMSRHILPPTTLLTTYHDWTHVSEKKNPVGSVAGSRATRWASIDTWRNSWLFTSIFDIYKL